MANMDSFNELTLPYLPGAELGVLRLHIRRVLREFFKRSTVWRETVAFSTTANTAAYRFLPTTGQVASILRVEYDKGQLPVLPEAQHRVQATAVPGAPSSWHSALPAVITLYPVPNAVYPVSVSVALTIPIAQLATNDDAFPDDIFATYGEDIASGVIGYMMSMPGKPWTTAGAESYVRRYENMIRTLRGKLRDGGQPSVSTLHGPRIT